jgi:hypothetical protein
MIATSRASAARWSTRSWLVLAALLLAIGLARVSAQQPDDDNLWLAYSGIPATAEARNVEHQFTERVSNNAQCAFAGFRLALRERYADNYRGYLLVNSALYRSWRSVDGPGFAAAWNALASTRFVMFALSMLALLWAASRLRGDLQLAVAGAIIGMAGLDILVHSGLVLSVSLPDMTRPLKSLALLAYSFVFAAEPHSIFGMTPRNVALTLFATGMILRWARRPWLGALAVLLAGAMHQTYGGISLFLFALTTAVSRPDLLKPRTVRATLLAAALIYFLRDRYFVVGPVLKAAMVLGVVAIGAAAFAIVQSPAYARIRERVFGRFATEEILLDAAVCVTVCIVITCAALVAAPRSPPAIAHYLWSDLTIRMWSFARVIAFVAAFSLLLRSLRGQKRWLASGATAVSGILAVIALIQVDWAGLTRGPTLETVDATAARTSGIQLPAEESVLYAHLLLVSAKAESSQDLARRLLGDPLSCDQQVK